MGNGLPPSQRQPLLAVMPHLPPTHLSSFLPPPRYWSASSHTTHSLPPVAAGLLICTPLHSPISLMFVLFLSTTPWRLFSLSLPKTQKALEGASSRWASKHAGPPSRTYAVGRLFKSCGCPHGFWTKWVGQRIAHHSFGYEAGEACNPHTLWYTGLLAPLAPQAPLLHYHCQGPWLIVTVSHGLCDS